MKSYFAYIRVSTVKQGERGSSLQEQRSAIEAYAQRNDLAIRGWFEEMETAAKQGRRAFNRMLADLGRRYAAGVIIHKIDRGSRNLRDWARLGELMDRGIEVHFVHDNLDLSTRGGRLSADIQAVVAADYVRNLREEVKKGRYGRLKQGFYPLPAPTGYLNCGTAKPKTICPARGPLVREAFELYGTGNYSVKLLRERMATKGLTTGAGAPLAPSHLTHILHNPFYMGLMRLNSTGEVFQGNHEPLIPAALYERVQAIMSGRQYPRVQINRFLFRRIIKCGACGRSLTGERKKGHVYYRCHSYACRGTSARETDIDALVRQELSRLHFDDGDVGDFRDVLAEQGAADAAHTREEADRVARDLGLVEQRLERLTDAVLDNTIDKATYDRRRAALLGRRQELNDVRERNANSTKSREIGECFELGFAAYHGYEFGNDEEKREILRAIGSNFIVRGKNVEFPMHSPFAELRNWSQENGSWPLRGAVRTSRRRGIRKLVQEILEKPGKMPQEADYALGA